MYCRECGEVITNENAVICIKCGARKGEGANYCPECGSKIKNKDAEVCLNCGIQLTKSSGDFTNQVKNMINSTPTSSGKNKTVAILLALFLGGAGIHRFYLGYKKIGLIQLGIFIAAYFIFAPAIFACYIWAIVDLVQIVTGKLDNVNGVALV